LANEHVKQEKKKKKDAKLWFRINVSDAELEVLHITKDDIADAPSWVLDTFITAIKKIKELQHNQLIQQNFINTTIQTIQNIHPTPVEPTTTATPE
jgi:tellurite resistance protein